MSHADRCVALSSRSPRDRSPAADWPQFLGPNRDSVSPEKVAAWTGSPEGRLEAAGRRRAQLAGRRRRRRVRLLPAEGEGRRRPGRVRRRDRREEVGEELRPRRSSRRRSATGRAARRPSPAARSTPSAAPASSPRWDAETGDVAWKVDTLKEFKAENLFFGVSTSPIGRGENRRRHGRRQGGRHRRVRHRDRQGRLEGDRRPGQLLLADRCRRRSEPAARLPHRRATCAASRPAGKVLWTFPFKDRLNESSTTPVKVGDLLDRQLGHGRQRRR